MTSAERLKAVLEHKTPDRFPVDLGATGTSTITRGAYLRLRKFLGYPDREPGFLSFTAQSVQPEEDILRHFHVDTRCVKPNPAAAWKAEVRRNGEYEYLTDEWGIQYRRPLSAGYYFDMCKHPLAEASKAEIEKFSFPQPDDPARISGLEERCKTLREKGFPVIFGMSFGYGILHTGTQLMGYDDFFTRIILEPETIELLLERILDVKIRFWDLVLGRLGPFVDVVAEADDLGTQRGPMISPDLYRRLIKPLQKRLFTHIKKKAPGVKIFYHSCGSIPEFIPDLIDAGIDALNPVQLSAQGMVPELLKREYGGDLVFWGGGIDTQRILPSGSPGEIKKAVLKNLSVFTSNGGYVFAAVHNIQDDVPPENIVAFFEAAEEFYRGA
jgi:uroporphyrinogen decarboxylase